MNCSKNRGFTIVELVIVVAVIAILAAVLVPTFSSVLKKAHLSNAIQNAKNTYTQFLIEQKEAIPIGDYVIVTDENGSNYAFLVISGNMNTTPYSEVPSTTKGAIKFEYNKSEKYYYIEQFNDGYEATFQYTRGSATVYEITKPLTPKEQAEDALKKAIAEQTDGKLSSTSGNIVIAVLHEGTYYRYKYNGTSLEEMSNNTNPRQDLDTGLVAVTSTPAETTAYGYKGFCISDLKSNIIVYMQKTDLSECKSSISVN